MRNYILVICLLLLSSGTLWAQEQRGGVATVVGSAASQTGNLNHNITIPVKGVNKNVTIQSVGIQVGMPYMGVKDVPFTNNPTQYYNHDLGFPWGIRYRYNTFAEDAFTVSKGYFSDRIELNWDIKQNREKIVSISIYRSEDIDSQNPNWGKALKTLPADAGTFSDNNVEGGKLYRYKVAAKGVEVEGLEILYTTYITGIGYRNPTGVVTGNISFTGGNPVKDVLVTANPTGSQLRFGSSLKIPGGGYVSVPRLHKALKDSITLQAWFKPINNLSTWNTALPLYNLASDANESLVLNVWSSTQDWRPGVTAPEQFIQLSFGSSYIALFGYYPSGEIDNSGEDILVPISNINTSFVHFSAVIRDNKAVEFYINGRLMNYAYRDKMTSILAKKGLPLIRLDINSTPVKLNTTANGHPQTWTHFNLGGAQPSYLDEFRVWETALTPAQIRRDYRRYLNGNEAFLHTYISANESIGDYAYDLAHDGFSYNGNNAKLIKSSTTGNTPTFDNGVNNIPTNTQLGILGVTDEFGNYVISAVPYKGNGDSFTIVPSLGKHEFNPKQQLAFLGVGSTVVNKIDFTDKSSFVFKGHAVYDSRNVFPKTSDAPITGDIKDDESYNAYVKGNLKYQKGEYWADKDATNKIIRLNRYAQIPVPGAFVSIDGVQAIDANNAPIQTDIDGRFTLQVPIGQHAITLTKDGHTFAYDGRYPAKITTVSNAGVTTVTNTYQDFYEDRDEPVTFIDNTKILVVGRVVGGTAQADKTIGFGYDGKKTYSYRDAAGVSKSTIYTSLNNIGTAQLTLGYLPTGATSVTPEYKTSFTTNVETGEYRVSLLPLSYMLSQNDLHFTSNRNPDNKPLLDADRVINFTTIKPLQYPKFTQGKDTITGQPYQEVLKFTHIATPIQKVLSQTWDQNIVLNGTTYTVTDAQTTPIYTQFGSYKIEVQGQEIYRNYDNSATNPAITTVPVEGGTLVVTNNLALENSEKLEASPTDPSILIYTFKGGTPNTNEATGFKRTIDLKFRSNGVDYPLTDYKTDGILMGGEADGSQTFVTAGPQIPDFILRDPPGSASSASIEKGSTFSFSKESSSSASNGTDVNTTVSLGFKMSVGGGLAGPVMETETTNDLSTGITMSQSSSNGKSVTNTYSFNQTISTSDDPNFVGGDADLYIGTSANQYYGTYNNLAASTTANTVPIKVSYLSGTRTVLTNLYPKVNKAIYINDAPEKTLFVYTQHHILNELIPSYQEFIDQIEDGTLVENQNGVLTKSAYLSSINLWRKIILNNELSKYQALKDKDKLKVSLNAIIESLKDPKTGTLSASAKAMKDLLNATFFENISFDAGVGEITKGFQTGRLTGTSQSYELQLDASVVAEVGAEFNETGFGVETSTTSGSGSGNSSSDDDEETTNVSYTLKDNDPNNVISVDIINAFDGNGPIFITKGGQTSCPYEGPQLSYFYNPTHANATNPSATIVPLEDSKRIELSVATIALEKPEITVQAADVAGVFDGRNAEFVLQLRNTSTANKDASFLLTVDQSTNPDNAAINIEPNGTIINIPAGKTVTYTMTLKKVKQDQFDYKNIKVVLQSMCDDDAMDTVLVSASFVPACSPVTVMAPANNWLLNRNTAYETNGTTKPLNIKLGDFNTSFASFQKISLEYRLKGTPNWVNLRTYYKNQHDYDIAHTGGDTNIEMIVGTELNYAWDIAGLGLANGQYELRARTNCNNQTAFESQVIQGQVDLTAPVQFGTPTPISGILGIGDDLKLRFSEPIKLNGTVTKFEFLVQKNQSPVSHQVSLAFNGTNNTATINKPAITTGDFSIEFWLKNTTPSGTSTLLNQNGGLKIELINNELKYTIGGQSISATTTKDGTYNHYALSYDATANKLTIIENDKELKTFTPTAKLNFTNENPIVLGGNTFKGNMHDLRFWKRSITREASVANMNLVLNGNEINLLGYWPMNEGNGALANDLARYKHITIANTNWDINPKGTAYAFDGTNHLTLNQAAKVVISKEMDATMSFWMKTDQTSVATLFSNGYGDATDNVESNGYRNKWAISLNADGKLDLKAENKTLSFGNLKVNNNSWHHIAMSLTRNGTIRMYIDGNQMESYSSTDLGGFSSSVIFVGARSKIGATVDQYFKGTIDELCLWSTARNSEQIKADQYHEVNFNTTGLILYANLNKPEVANNNGPAYYYPVNATEKESSYALLNSKPLAFTDQTPAIKPFRPTESMVVNAVINNDEVILNPVISDWSTVEGKVAYVTVSNLNDMADNAQLSPITWTAFVNRNPTKWFVEGHTDVVNLMKRANENLSFEITIINRGGTTQSYNIELPSWLRLSANSGSIAPNSKMTLIATVDSDLAIGNHNTVLSLSTGYGYNEKIQLDLRVLEKEPTLTLDPSKFTQSVNIIGKVKINDVFTDDIYDKVVAMVNGEVRGMGSVVYDATFKEHFVYLTVYSNVVSGEEMSFYIWDASDGKLKEAMLNGKFTAPYIPDQILGNYTTPAIFTNTEVTGQQIAFNQGWTWTSFNVTDTRFNNLNMLTGTLSLSTSDLIKSNAPALFDAYQRSTTNPTESGWAGTISSNGGIFTNRMYKVKLETAQKLNIKGVPVNLNNWSIGLTTGWNWLPYVVSKNIPIADALANLNATDGDVIKSQSLFAIYSTVGGWKGSLAYLIAGEGYMLQTNKSQIFSYPEYLNQLSSKTVQSVGLKQNSVATTVITDEVVPLSSAYAKFANTMSAVVKLPEGYKDLSFYNEAGELRGHAKTQYVDGVDLAFITLYGDKKETLKAFVGAGSKLQATSKSFNFTPDAVLGSIPNPVIIELAKEKVSIFPNPFHRYLDVLINSEERGDVKVSVYAVSGQKVFERAYQLNLGVNTLKLDLDQMPTGVYIINLKIADKVINQKVIKN